MSLPATVSAEDSRPRVPVGAVKLNDLYELSIRELEWILVHCRSSRTRLKAIQVTLDRLEPVQAAQGTAVQVNVQVPAITWTVPQRPLSASSHPALPSGTSTSDGSDSTSSSPTEGGARVSSP